jgi:mono/diheme cytochrome c family protein
VLKKVLKWIGIITGGLVGLLVVVLVVLYIIGTAKVNKTYDVPVETISIPTDAAALERGEHLATILICTRCHVENMAGKVDFAIPGMLTIPTPNLTTGTGGVGSFYTDADWVRAIRHGVGHDGRALFIMPSKSYYYLGDEDLGAIIAYLKSLPPVDNELPERRIELLGRLMDGAGMFPPDAVEQIDHTGPRPTAPEPGVTVAYGEYLARTCTECHGANLNGIPFGPPGEEVPSPNLTPGGKLAAWSEEDFFSTIRTGVTPEGHQLNIDMPWMYYARMSDEELRALWLYLQSLPALAQGG